VRSVNRHFLNILESLPPKYHLPAYADYKDPQNRMCQAVANDCKKL